ncbi:MAG: SPASM domain-containing protein [Chitinophagales bacterium]|nr:SPASM domain-containing protein [Chitinophagales bacterium]
MKAKWQNDINFFSTLTPRRAWNMLKIYVSFYISKYLKKPIQWGKPFSIAIEPTTSCNLRCPECPSGLRSFTRDTGMLEPEMFESIIDQVYKHVNYLTFYFQGEPYLNKHFLSMVSYAKTRNIYTATSTNGHFLTNKIAEKTVESGLDRLIISIDGTTQDTYEQYRIGGNIDRVIEGAKNVIRWKKKLKSKTPFVIFQFLVVRHNEHQIPELRKIAKEIGVDQVILKTAQIYDYKHGNPLIPLNDKYSRYKKMPDGTYEIKNKMENSCWKLWHSCVVTWDGRVLPCCFDKDARYVMGYMSDKSFDKIWWGNRYYKFREKLVRSRQEIDMCRNCSEGCTVNINYDF